MREDVSRYATPKEVVEYINVVGFLPLFSNEIPGFSVEDRAISGYWWTGIREKDPWEWREIITRSGNAIYGKFFNRKTGFVSKEWFPVFANYRRNGYDFDARWEDGLASIRAKKIIDIFGEDEELYSCEIKQKAGFGKEGEKNFEGVITDLQMQSYLVTKDFRRRTRKKDGSEYGWSISVYTTPERLLGYDVVREAYKEDPRVSLKRIFAKIKQEYPGASEKDILKVMK